MSIKNSPLLFAMIPILIAVITTTVVFIGSPIRGDVVHFENEGVPIAEFELQCRRDLLSKSVLPNRRIGVSGCGKTAIYVWKHGDGWNRVVSER